MIKLKTKKQKSRATKHKANNLPIPHDFKLEDPSQPDLFRETFPYSEIPRIHFESWDPPVALPKEFWVTDTTFRDGQQAMEPFSAQQIVDLYKLIAQLAGPKGIVRYTEFFLYTKKDREALERCRNLGLEYPIITSWIRANRGDFELVKDMKLTETGILCSSSDYHIFHKLKKTRAQALQMYLDVVKEALDNGIIPRIHLEDVTRSDIYGFVVPFAIELMKLSKQYKSPVKIRACDTMGVGLALPNVALPRSVPKVMHALNKLAGVPNEWLEWHGHNDLYRAVDNGVNAWLYGCAAVNTTCLGIGERTGNTPMEGMIMEYLGLKHSNPGIDTTVITEIKNYFEKEMNYPAALQAPLVGKYFNVTRAGIHADGLIKDEEIYNIFDTKKILNRAIDVQITDKSGLAGIIYWLNSRLKPEQNFEKSDPRVLKIHEWVMGQYQDSRISSISEREIWEQVKINLPEYYPLNPTTRS